MTDEEFLQYLRQNLAKPFRLEISAEDEVREVVFRAALGAPSARREEFLLVESGADPSLELFERLQASYPGIRPRSAAKKLHNLAIEDHEVAGTLYVIAELQWHGTERCDVKCGVVFGPLCGYGHLYRVERRNGRWVVAGRTFAWKS